MWLFSKVGFLSIVKHKFTPGMLLVRSRVRDDLEHFLNVVDRLGNKKYVIEETADADYRFRTTVSRKLVAQAVSQLVMEIDYPNFKDAVHGDPRRDSAYMKVWSAMNDLQKAKLGGKSANQIAVIRPYYLDDLELWVFDDPAVGLVQEPFVSGVPEIIDDLVSGIPDARNGFRLFFSASAFPGWQRRLKRLREEEGGWWYASEKPRMEGWLCPAMFNYFVQAPAELYVRAEPKANALE